MYGLLLQSVQHFVQKDFGEEIWHRVLRNAQIDTHEFTTHTRYSDTFMVKLAEACETVIGGRTSNEFMRYFGKCFVGYFTHYGYDRILRVSGRHFRDFLRGIDNIHETMRFSYPKMLSPSFCVRKEDEHGCILHYRSKRKGFTLYVAGQLEECAKDFYGIDLHVSVVNEEIYFDGCHITYRLNFDNTAFKSQQCQKYQSPSSYNDIQGNFFLKIFPFSVVFNRNLCITHSGPAIKRLFPDYPVIGVSMKTVFTLRRPLMDFTWDNIICMEQVQFELQSLYKAKNKASDTERSVLLKGEMRYMADFNGMVFLCSLLISDVDELQSLGLYLNDLNMYDSSREMVVAGCQHASRLEYSIEKQVARSQQIEANLKRLDEERQTSEKILYSMIPKSTAMRLKNGEDPVSTCEVFESVSIMFSYLVGFTDLCHHIPAISLLQCINSVFSNFDKVTDNYDVFKVETLGDAVYMVAGGVPERKPGHAYQVACVAMDLLQKIDSVSVPQDAQVPKLQIRIGIHTGSVVGGVVGMRMPQYCLFGDTVNTASRMQTYSESGKIHISETTNRCLEGSKLQTVYRGKIHVKGKGEMKTYWLLNKQTQEHNTTPTPDTVLDSTVNINGKRAVEDLYLREAEKFADIHEHKKETSRQNANRPSKRERSCEQTVKECLTSCVQTQHETDKNSSDVKAEDAKEDIQLEKVYLNIACSPVSENECSFSAFTKPEAILQTCDGKRIFTNDVDGMRPGALTKSAKKVSEKQDQKKKCRRSSLSGILQCPFSLFGGDGYKWNKMNRNETSEYHNGGNNETLNCHHIPSTKENLMTKEIGSSEKCSRLTKNVQSFRDVATQVDVALSATTRDCQSTQTNLSLVALQENITFCPACGRNGLIKKPSDL